MRATLAYLTLALLSCAGSASAAFADRQSRRDSRNTAGQVYRGQRIVPGKFMIEVEQDDQELVKRSGGVVQLLDSILTHLASPPSSSSSSPASSRSSSSPVSFDLNLTLSLPSLTAQRTFSTNPKLFTGATVSVQDEGILKSLVNGRREATEGIVRGLEGVKGIKRAWPLRLIPAPRPVTPENLPVASGSLSSFALAASLTRRASRGRSYANDTFGPHLMTGVEKLHAQGILGAGVKVGVIDTGVDYLNPLLGGCFGSDCPISFGASFVTSSGEPSSGSTPVSGDPYTNCTEHGTHVTGILTSRASSLGFSGVAPEATVGHYRVFDCTESTSEDLVVAALLQASQDDCDVISMSLGSNIGWLGASPSQVVVERLVKKEGRVVVVSAGNDRAEGLFFGSGPASTEAGISVGSVDAATLPAYPLTSVSPPFTLPYLSASPLGLSNLPFTYPKTGLRLYFTSTDPSIEDDACDALPEGLDLSKRVTVIKRGTCTFDQKVANAMDRGAQIILIYNSPSSGNQIPYLTASTYPGLVGLASLRTEEGAKLLEVYLKRPRGVFVSFLQDTGMVNGVVDNEGGGVVSYYSEYGPTFELLGQPSLTAPGGNILSTFPLSMGGVGVISGTSMSCPFVSGAVALLLSQRKGLSPNDVRALLATTAKKTYTTVNSTTADSVLSQGGGLLQVDKALATGTILTPFELALNDTTYFTPSHTLTIRNTNSYPMSYTFSSSSAEGITTYTTSAADDIMPTPNPPNLSVPSAARISFSTRVVLVLPGMTGTVTVSITPPRLARSQMARFPFYSGFVEVTGKAVTLGGMRESLGVPYFGLAAKMSDMPVFDTSATIYGDVKYPFIASGSDYQIKANSYGYTTGFDIYTRLAAGTRFLSIDLIAANTSFPATIPSERTVSSTSSYSTDDSTSDRMAKLRKRDPVPFALAAPHPHPRPHPRLHALSLDLSLDTSADSGSLLSHLSLNTSLSLSSPTLPNQSKSSPAPSNPKGHPRLYSDTRILGIIFRSTLVPRDYLVNSPPHGYSEIVTSFVPSEAEFGERLEGGGEYRVLIRALKTTADPALESSYESYVSYPFKLAK
ncbi:hypothetical protein JCM11641_005753 [Rhodosporidiobolus odoratus]